MNRRSFLFLASATGVLSARPGGVQHALDIPPLRRGGAPAPGPLCRGAQFGASAQLNGTPTALPGNAIPKYVAIAEFQQPVLPASLYVSLPGPYRGGTLVWGYNVGGAPPHYPGFTFERF